MATIEQEIKVLAECMRTLASGLFDAAIERDILAKLNAISSDAGEKAEVKKACEHKEDCCSQWSHGKGGQTQWVSVICCTCGLVGRKKYGTIGFDNVEWWPDANAKAVAVLERLQRKMAEMGWPEGGAIQGWTKRRLRELSSH